MESPNITVLWTCNQCGQVDREVQVPARTDEQLMDWMQWLGVALSRDHDRVSPGCKIQKMSEVKIPALGTDRVGGAPVN